MSKTFQPDSLHPYIMDARLKKATGSGGISNIPIASADTVGGIKVPADSGITITGSGNAYAAKPIVYSTDEVDTGAKWIDGKNIFSKTIHASDVTLTTTSIIDATLTTASVDTVEKIVGTMKDSDGNIFENYMYYDAGQLLRATPMLTSSGLSLLINGLTIKAYNITVQYTKPTTP